MGTGVSSGTWPLEQDGETINYLVGKFCKIDYSKEQLLY